MLVGEQVPGEEARAQATGGVPEGRRDDGGQLLERDSLLHRGPKWCEQGFPGLGQSATDDERARVQQGEGGDQAVGEGVDGVLPDPDGGGVAGFDGLGAVGGVGLGVAARLGPGLGDGGGGGVPLQAAALAAAAGGAAGRTTMWPISPA